jgi:hypothetical protein
VSATDHPHSLRLNPSSLNLTALNGNYAGPTGQAFVGRRQQDTLFTYSVVLDFSPRELEEEAGVTTFLTQNHHMDLGVVMLPTANTKDRPRLVPHFRFRGISYVKVPDPVVEPVPESWIGMGKKLRLEIKAVNMSHYSFSAGPADAQSEMRTIVAASNAPVSWGFTGKELAVSRSLAHDLGVPHGLFRRRAWRQCVPVLIVRVWTRRPPRCVFHEQRRQRDNTRLLLRMEVYPTRPVQGLREVEMD